MMLRRRKLPDELRHGNTAWVDGERVQGGLHLHSSVGAARPNTQHWGCFQAQACLGRSDVSTARPSGLTQR